MVGFKGRTFANLCEARPRWRSRLQLQRVNLSYRVKQSIPGKPPAQAGLPDGWTRATFIVREGQVEQLKALARYLKKAGTEEVLKVYLRGKGKVYTITQGD